jgi:hypothetical protein
MDDQAQCFDCLVTLLLEQFSIFFEVGFYFLASKMWWMLNVLWLNGDEVVRYTSEHAALSCVMIHGEEIKD